MGWLSPPQKIFRPMKHERTPLSLDLEAIDANACGSWVLDLRFSRKLNFELSIEQRFVHIDESVP